jgi:hypothetical protein
MDDTQAKIKQRYGEMILSKSPLERLKMASRMHDSARKLAISGILKERPHLEVSRLRARLFLRMYGNDFTATERERIIKKIPNMQLDTES